MAIENYAGNYGYNYAPQYTPRTQYQRGAAPQFGNGEGYDSYQSSGGGVVGGATYTALGAGAGGAAGYFLMGNPISEGENGLKVNERFYKALDNAIIEEKVSTAIKSAETEALNAVNIANHEEYNALKKLANAQNLDALPDEVKNALPKDVTTPDAAKELVTKAEAELAKVDKTTIAKSTKEAYIAEYYTNSESLNLAKNFEKAETELAKLADDVKPNELKEFISKNKELFGIKGEEAAVTAEIERLSNLGKADLLKYIGDKKAVQQKLLAETDKTILSNINKESKALIEEAPDVLKNAFKEFKWSQAKRFGLWGGATALGAYLISSLFSSGNKKA